MMKNFLILISAFNSVIAFGFFLSEFHWGWLSAGLGWLASLIYAAQTREKK